MPNAIASKEILKQGKVAVVAAKWNSFVTDEMMEAAVDALKSKGFSEENILQARCPGSFELPLACKWYAEQKA